MLSLLPVRTLFNVLLTAYFSFKLIELTETQSLENMQLKREKAMIENDLLKTQVENKTFQVNLSCLLEMSSLRLQLILLCCVIIIVISLPFRCL